MCKKTSMNDLKGSSPENWESLFKKARQSDLIQLRLNESKGPVRSRAEVELERRKMNTERFAIIISVLSFLVSCIAVLVSIS